MVLSSRINDSARIRAFSSRGGVSANIVAISRICCLASTVFLLDEMARRVTAILRLDLREEGLYPPMPRLSNTIILV